MSKLPNHPKLNPQNYPDDYILEINRNPNKINGPGFAYLWHFEDTIARWNCITGSKNLDPYSYGGITPPIDWAMMEPIKYRRHPKGYMMTMARIYPLYEDEKNEFSERTFNLNNVPFMIHKAGTSTGCIAIDKNDWQDAREKINNAWFEQDGALLIVITEDEDL